MLVRQCSRKFQVITIYHPTSEYDVVIHDHGDVVSNAGDIVLTKSYTTDLRNYITNILIPKSFYDYAK